MPKMYLKPWQCPRNVLKWGPVWKEFFKNIFKALEFKFVWILNHQIFSFCKIKNVFIAIKFFVTLLQKCYLKQYSYYTVLQTHIQQQHNSCFPSFSYYIPLIHNLFLYIIIKCKKHWGQSSRTVNIQSLHSKSEQKNHAPTYTHKLYIHAAYNSQREDKK